MSNLLYSSAVLTLSQTTEFMRNKSIDNTIIHLIVANGKEHFSINQAYESIKSDLPIRIEEIEKSLIRSYESGVLEIKQGKIENPTNVVFSIPEKVRTRIKKQYDLLENYLDESIDELFTGIVTKENRNELKDLLLNVLTNLMAKYGYAYAGQLAGVGDATEFVPTKELKLIAENSIKESSIKIETDTLTESISILFDRRNPCLNNLAFSICNRYYLSRLIGLDLPIDFLTQNIYKDSTIFLDTNFIMRIAFSRSQRHNEFREILKRANDLGIKFVASELTVAEIHARVGQYEDELDSAEEILPEDLIHEVRDEILETSHNGRKNGDFKIEESENASRLEQMGIELVPFDEKVKFFSKKELEDVKEELHKFDRKYRAKWQPKNDNALFHDAYLYFLINDIRSKSGISSSWFLTMDNSVIEHGIAKKAEENPPYSIRLLSLLQTLSQFVESQALKGEFADMFGELISKDLLPRDQLFSYSDLKLLIGFDIKAKEIPPEFVRKATLHIKNNVLKGGGLTDKNKAEVIQEFHKFLATPEHNFLELQKKYDKKLWDRDEDLKLKDNRIKEFEEKVKEKDGVIDNLNDRVQALELERKKDKYNSEVEKYQSNKKDYIKEQVDNSLESFKRLRNKYVIFIIIAFAIFTAIFFIESISLWLGKVITVNDWVRYLLAAIIFLAPFIRSFFEHKKVIQGFRLLSSKYKKKIVNDLKIEFEKKYELENEKPILEN